MNELNGRLKLIATIQKDTNTLFGDMSLGHKQFFNELEFDNAKNDVEKNDVDLYRNLYD